MKNRKRPAKALAFAGRSPSILSLALLLWLIVWSIIAAAQTPTITNIPFLDAGPVLRALRQDLLPSDLRGLSLADAESMWPSWVISRDDTIRLRLEEGDDDSVGNLLLYGVTFTAAPRVTELDISNMTAGHPAPGALRTRIEDLIVGIGEPGGNERLQFARELVQRRNIDVRTAEGKNQVRRWLDSGVNRTVAEYKARLDLIAAEASGGARDPSETAIRQSTVFRGRGLAPDTTLFPGYGIEETLEALKSHALLAPGGVSRVAVVGPGLDFADKREGYDFYPQQTIQPFAVIDSLRRLDLASTAGLRLTTFDLSPRINHHLAAALEYARAGSGYVLQIPKQTAPFPWAPFLVKYWEQFGDRIGEPTTATVIPSGAANVVVRGVKVRPDVVLSIDPQDVNIILQRLDPLAPGERFDVIVATNVLLYYDSFEQCLAVANVAKMLRPGGFLLANTAVLMLPSMPVDLVGYTDVGYTDRDDGDRIFWYQRR